MESASQKGACCRTADWRSVTEELSITDPKGKIFNKERVTNDNAQEEKVYTASPTRIDYPSNSVNENWSSLLNSDFFFQTNLSSPLLFSIMFFFFVGLPYGFFFFFFFIARLSQIAITLLFLNKFNLACKITFIFKVNSYKQEKLWSLYLRPNIDKALCKSMSLQRFCILTQSILRDQNQEAFNFKTKHLEGLSQKSSVRLPVPNARDRGSLVQELRSPRAAWHGLINKYI